MTRNRFGHQVGCGYWRAERVVRKGQFVQGEINAALSHKSNVRPVAVDSMDIDYRKDKEPKPIHDQIMVLAETFNIDPRYALEYADHLSELKSFIDEDELVVRWFAILSENVFFPSDGSSCEKYCEAVNIVHDAISRTRPFNNFYKRRMNPDRLRVNPRTQLMMDKVTQVQPGGIILIPARLKSYVGFSAFYARQEFADNEFGLGSLAGSSIALVYPERFLKGMPDLDLPGDDFCIGCNRWSAIPTMRILHKNGIGYGARFGDRPHARYGAGSGFIPPPEQ